MKTETRQLQAHKHTPVIFAVSEVSGPQVGLKEREAERERAGRKANHDAE